MTSVILRLIQFSAMSLFLISITNCTFSTPEVETPQLNSKAEVIDKSLFVSRTPNKSSLFEAKKFICGYVSLNEKGYIGEQVLLHGAAANTDHCNLEWKITHKFLIGMKVSPTYPNDRSKWQEIITIPITKHYYYERALDDYGSETNKVIKNDQKDSWEIRPYMDLDLSQLKIHDWAYKMFITAPLVTSVTDIDIDTKDGFFAFTIDAMDAVLGAELQGKFRFNFKSFKHNPKFKKTPYHMNNAKKFNALHLLGKKVEGLAPSLYAGHWDLSKTNDVYLNNFPEEYELLAEEVVAQWNKAFEDINAIKKGHKPFKITKKKLKYAFDLRYPSITWVSDKKISSHSPLGIGLAYADVLNGEILWGGITLYGGLIEHYIQNFSPSDAINTSGKSNNSVHVDTLFDKNKLFKSYSKMPTESSIANYLKSDQARLRLVESLNFERDRLTRDAKNLKNSEVKSYGDLKLNSQQINQLVSGLEKLDTSKPLNSQTFYLNVLNEDLNRSVTAPQALNHENFFDKLFTSHVPEPSAAATSSATGLTGKSRPSANVALSDLNKRFGQNITGLDRTFADVGPGLTAAISQRSKEGDFNYKTAIKIVVKWLIIHEYGHFLGLGHQFEGNILPEKGTVPDAIYNDQLRMAQNHHSNTTTVMDYLSPRSEVYSKYEDIKPGPHDKLVLRYLYNRQFPGFRSGLTHFKFETFSEDSTGLIPDQFADPDDPSKTLKTTYFRACGDVEASIGHSPYCARFDRGHDATTISKYLVDDFFGTLVSDMNAFTSAGGSNSDYATNRLWQTSLTTFSKLRVFYDHMRDQLKSNPKYSRAFSRIKRNSKSLYDFSEACIDPSKAEENAREDFKILAFKNPSPSSSIENSSAEDFSEIHNLCVANKYILDQFGSVFSRAGSDHTIVNYDDAVVPAGVTGGDAELNWGRLWGSWTELSSLPLRLSALLTLTTPEPFFMWSGYTIPIPRYSDSEAKYGYHSLYPKEFTKIVNTAVQQNLKFGGTIYNESAEMGVPLLYLKYFLDESFYGSNDSERRFPTEFIKGVRSQTNIEFSIVPIILANVATVGKSSSRVFQYKATYYDGAKRTEVDIPYAYLLPDRDVIAKGKPGQLFYPVSKFRYITDTWGYVWAYELKINSKYDDQLSGQSPKNVLNELYISQLNKCVASGDKGLSSFFHSNNDDFLGFEVIPGIANSTELHIRFNESLKNSYASYYKATGSEKAFCEESFKGLGLVISSGAVLNGYWIPEAFDYLVK